MGEQPLLPALRGGSANRALRGRESPAGAGRLKWSRKPTWLAQWLAQLSRMLWTSARSRGRTGATPCAWRCFLSSSVSSPATHQSQRSRWPRRISAPAGWSGRPTPSTRARDGGLRRAGLRAGQRGGVGVLDLPLLRGAALPRTGLWDAHIEAAD